MAIQTSDGAEVEFSSCLLPRSDWNIVSLGAPLAPERLGNKNVVRLGVLPFKFSDTPGFELSKSERINYQQAAASIEKLSNYKVKVDLIFFPTVNSKMTIQNATQMTQQRDTGWRNWDLSKSTFGIVKEIVNNVDPILDFSNLNGIILENKSRSFGSVAEAFQFFREPPDQQVFIRGLSSGLDFNFFRSIKTQEGIIDNAILFDSHHGSPTIVHEVLHNFGLTDLYGGGASDPYLFSAMAHPGTFNLLHYEKAVLGWFPKEQFRCVNLADIDLRFPNSYSFSIEDVSKDQILLIKTQNSDGYILEVRQEFIIPALIMYELRQDDRPPISVLGTTKGVSERISLADPYSIGNSLTSEKLQVMVTEIKDKSAKLALIPISQLGSKEFEAIRFQSAKNRDELISQVEIAATKSLKTITCVKGKVTKKMTAVKPKCPSGYKLKK